MSLARLVVPSLLLALCGCPPPAATPDGAVGEAPTSRPTSQPTAAAGPGAEFAQAIEAAHHAETWRAQGAIRAHMSLTFGGKQQFTGTLLLDPQVAHARLELDEGPTVVFDGETAWLAPGDAEFPRARFHVLTWPFFLAAPYKLQDAGTSLAPLGELTLEPEGPPLAAAKLTYEAGVGDSPDDWYVVYRDGEGRLSGLGYIVTYGGKDPASAEPHAVLYRDHQPVEGVPVPRRWEFRLWTQDKGVFDDPIGEVLLDRVEFVQPAADAFQAPEGATELTLPE
ncbi:MAG: hypothetical protein R3F62_09795 [Planctomycetota bacterium]